MSDEIKQVPACHLSLITCHSSLLSASDEMDYLKLVVFFEVRVRPVCAAYDFAVALDRETLRREREMAD